MAILGANGAESDTEIEGEIAAYSVGSDAWVKTGQRGLYRVDAVSGRRFFYLS